MYEEHDIIRTDLWPTMSQDELQKQLDILLSRTAGLGSIMGNVSNPVQYQAMYQSLQQACDHLSYIIANPVKNTPIVNSNLPSDS